MSIWYDSHIILIQLTLTNFLLALSIQVPLRVGVASFAGVGFYAIGGYSAAITTSRYSWSEPMAILAGVGVSVVAAACLGVLVRGLSGMYLGMATIAFDLILSVIVINGGEFTGGSQGLFGVLADVPVWSVAVTLLGIVVLLAFSEVGRPGRRIEVVREDPELAASLGIRVGRVRWATFIVSSVLGSAGGALNTLFRSTITPDDIGFSLVVLALTMIILGGARSWVGAMVGVVIFTWLPSMLTFLSHWQTVVYGAVVTLAAVWLPNGLVGLVSSLVRRLTVSRRTAGSKDASPIPGASGAVPPAAGRTTHNPMPASALAEPAVHSPSAAGRDV